MGQQEGRTLPMFGKSKQTQDREEPMKFGFIPQQMKNKNKEEAEEPKHNTITKMFKNAPPPKKVVK